MSNMTHILRTCCSHFKLVWVVFIVVSFFFFGSAVAAETPPPSQAQILYNSQNNTLSVNLRNATIAEFAGLFSAKTGIKTIFDPEIDNSLNIRFDDMPLELGLKRVLGPVSSSLIFAEIKKEDGTVDYRLKMVKIFQRGNMNESRFVEAGKGRGVPGSGLGAGPSSRQSGYNSASSGPSVNSSTTGLASGSGSPSPMTPGAIRHAIIEGQKNLSILRRKSQAEEEHIDLQIAAINRQLSQNPPADQRAELVKQLADQNQQLVRVKNLNSRIMIEEEKNLRSLAEQAVRADEPARNKRMSDSERQNARRTDVMNQLRSGPKKN